MNIGLLKQIDELPINDLEVVMLFAQRRMESLRGLDEGHVDDFARMQEIRGILEKRGPEFSGTDATLLCCYYVQLSGSDTFNARQVNTALMEAGRNIANITTTMDSLRQKQFIETTSTATGSHKMYHLTESGRATALKLMSNKIIPYKNNSA